MANPVVGIDIAVRLDQLKAQLASIPDIGGKAAKDLTAQLSREIKQAEEAAKRAKKPTQDLRNETTRFADAAGAAGSGAKKLRGLFGMLGSEASALAGFVDDAGDAVEVFSGVSGASAAAAGGTAAALAALALAYQATTGDIARAAETSASLQRAHESLIPAERELRDVQIDVALATGQMNEEMAASARLANKARDAMTDFAVAQNEERKALRESTASAEQWLSIIDKDSIVGGMVDAVAGWSNTISENKTREDALNAALVEQHDTIKQARQETDLLTDATKKNTAADTSAKEAKEAAYQARLWNLKKQEQVERDAILGRQEMDAAAVKSAMLDEEARTKKAEEETQKRIELAKLEAEAQAAAQEQVIGAYASMAGSVASIAGTMAETVGAEHQQAALAWFGVQKGAAMVEAGINTILAVSKANTATPYPPVNAVLMAAAGAMGVAQEVAIAAQPPPSFADTPGVMQMTGGGAVNLAAGDYFAAAKDPAELQRQAGATDATADYRSGGGTYTVIGHRAFGRFISDDIRDRTPLSTLFGARRDRPLGRRA
ncbi:hypothetical protein [Janthinobacterium sp.]|uniref:hypothetical protein n=1 Tax=Janthinobacterium sp. TaxID=1871054 RepID=UPI0025BEC8E1|nr:hypothetical protein [Janthinobacterium sp.]